jgi:peptide/nickel transport system substrate-binding protein
MLTNGCSTNFTNTQQDVLHVAALAGPITLNPIFVRDGGSAETVALLHPQLLGTNPDTLEIEPRLISSWQRKEDNLTYIFTLHEGVTWSDGTPLTAQDVAFTIRVICHGDYTGWMFPLLEDIEGAAEYRKARDSSYADGSISGLKVLDTKTLQIRLKKPYAPFLSHLGFPPLPAHFLQDIHVAELELHPYSRTLPVSAGPYLLQEWRQDEYIHVRANPNYYLGKPAIEEIYYRFIANPEAQLIELLAGKLDLIPTTVKPEDVQTLLSNPEIRIYQNRRLVYDYIGFNYADSASPLRDKRVRRALSMLLNKEELVENLLLGYGEALRGPLLPLHFAYDPDFSRDRESLPAARNLLLEAGYPSLKVKLIYNSGNTVRENVALLLQEKAAQVGVDVQIQVLEWEAFLAALTNGDYDLVVLGRGTDADPDLSFHWHSQGPGNTMGYASDMVDELVENGASVFDKERRTEFYRMAQEQIVSDAPLLWLYTRQAIHAASAELDSFTAHPESLFYNVHLWKMQKEGITP